MAAILAGQIYMMSELRVRYQRIFIYHFNNFVTAKILIYSATNTDFLCKCVHFPRRYRRTKRGCVY